MTIYRLYDDDVGVEIGIFKSKTTLDFAELQRHYKADLESFNTPWGFVDALVADGHLTPFEVNDVFLGAEGLNGL